jgi:hypothetical protein
MYGLNAELESDRRTGCTATKVLSKPLTLNLMETLDLFFSEGLAIIKRRPSETGMK